MSASSSTSKPFELSPMLMLGLAGLLGLIAGAVALWQDPDNYTLMILLASMAVLFIAGVRACWTENDLLHHINRVLADASRGQLEARVTAIPTGAAWWMRLGASTMCSTRSKPCSANP